MRSGRLRLLVLPGLRQHLRHPGQRIRHPARVGDCGSGRLRLLVLPGLRQHLRHPGQRIRHPARVGDCGSGRLRLLVLPGLRQHLRHPGQRIRLPARVGDGGSEGLGAGRLAEGSPDGGQAYRDVGVAVGELVTMPGQDERGGQVRGILGGDEVQRGADLG